MATSSGQRAGFTLALLFSLSAVPAIIDVARADSGTDAKRVPTLPPDNEDLEQTFWACDQMSTRQFLSASEAAICSTAFELFKQRRFDGSFDALLQWWRQNKEAAHAKLNAAQKAR